jgi:iron complex transport system substrate-binding protein
MPIASRLTQIAVTVLAVASAGGAIADPISITDQRGRTVTLPRPAERVVFIPIPAPSTFMAIDGGPRRIVGINPTSLSAIREGILGRIFPAAATIRTDIVRSGFVPNVATILSLQPDVVFQWANEGEELIAVLDRVGLPTLGMTYGTQETLEGYSRMFAAVAGKPERVEEIIRRQRARRAALEQAMAGLPDAAHPRVLQFGRFAAAMQVAGSGDYTDFYIRLAGGANAAAELRGYGRPVTYEQVLAWDPQVILLGTFDPAKPDDLYNDPRWQAVRAVRERRVYRLPLGGYRWDPPSQESALTWTWVASLLQPERVRANLRADMAEWYEFLYGHRLTPAERSTRSSTSPPTAAPPATPPSQRGERRSRADETAAATMLALQLAEHPVIHLRRGQRHQAVGHLLLEPGQALLLGRRAVLLGAELEELWPHMAGADRHVGLAAAIAQPEEIAPVLAAEDLRVAERRVELEAVAGDAARHHLEGVTRAVAGERGVDLDLEPLDLAGLGEQREAALHHLERLRHAAG